MNKFLPSLFLLFNVGLHAQEIGSFTSIAPGAQTSDFVIPSTHRFQRLIEAGDQLTEGDVLMGNNDFTGYVPIGGSSENGYLSINAEQAPGGVSILDINYDASSKIWQVTRSEAVDFNPVLLTIANCSGTVTPWNTIITCEEYTSADLENNPTFPFVVSRDMNLDGYDDLGWAIEIDPVTKTIINQPGGLNGPDKLWALGNFKHENAVIHDNERTLYQGGDASIGYLYKFVANNAQNLSSGKLYVYKGSKSGPGNWIQLSNTSQEEQNSTVAQSAAVDATIFNGIEDVEIGPNGMVYFAVKGENRVYRFQDSDAILGTTVTQMETYVGNATYTITHENGTTNVDWGGGNDNLAFDTQGNLWVMQDANDLQNYIWVVENGHTQSSPKVKIFGRTPFGSEPTGITFSPDNRFLFMSIQHPDGGNSSTTQLDAAGNSIGFDKSISLVISLESPPDADRIVLNTEKVVGSTITNFRTYTQDIVISNSDNEVLSDITILISGTDADQFSATGVPASINAQGSSSFQVNFTPTSNGPKSAVLTITGADAESVTIPLRGLGAAGFGGENEPSLQWVIDAQLGIGVVNVGDTDPATNPFDLVDGASYNDLIGDEISAQRFIRSQNGPVTLELLAAYGPSNLDIVFSHGWYESGNEFSVNELFKVSNIPGDNAQRLNPPIIGVTEFDPGIGEFGFYISWPFLNDRQVFSEDVLNTFDSAIPHKVRVYAIPEETDAYIIAMELVTSAQDYNDVVFVARNIRPFQGATVDDISLEAECGVLGSGWGLVSDANVSEGEYVSATSSSNYFSSAPTSADEWISFDFTATAGLYNMYALINVPNDDDDSFWVRANGGSWIKWNGLLQGGGFDWKQLYDSDSGGALVSLNLLEGANTLDIAIRENGAAIDKIFLSNTGNTPTGLGQQATNCGPIDELPVSNAGANVTLTLPDDTTLLSGTGSDPDGGLVSYLWTQISGPNTATLTSADTTDLTVAGLIEGTYVFNFAVTDEEVNTVSDQVSVLVEAAFVDELPIVDAGTDLSLTLPDDTTLLSGTGSDPDGGLVSYLWTQISGPNTATLTDADITDLTVTGLIEGTYVFNFAVTDEEGNTVSNQVSVSVSAVSAPSDIWLEAECATVGSGWSLVSDVNVSEGQYASATSGSNYYSSAPTNSDSWISFDFTAAAGTYSMYALINTPNDNNDSFWVRINEGTWIKWNNLLQGGGFDWRQLYNSDAGAALVSFDLLYGANTLDIAIRENEAAIDKIFLSNAGNTPPGLGQQATNCGPIDELPVSNAGADVTLTFPDNTGLLSGTGSDPDGGLVSYLWSQISGPNTAILTDADTTDLTVTGLIEGTYVFNFAVSDEEGNTVSDQVSVLVNTNMTTTEVWLEAECATVGSGWSLVSDVNVSEGQYASATSGSNYYSSAPMNSEAWISFDFTAAAGTYNMYALINTPNDNNDSFWVRVNGGSWIKWNNLLQGGGFDWRQLYDSDSNSDLVSFDLLDGANILDVAIRENGASIDKIYLSDSTMVPTGLGQSATNCFFVDELPIVDAGADVTLTLPGNMALLSGTGSDPDGGLVTYLWTQVTGPDTATLTGENTADLTVDGLMEGTYVFSLGVTDNESNTVSDEVSLFVSVVTAPSDLWLEAECATVGSGWSLVSDVNVSEGQYASATSGSNYYSSAPTNSEAWISFDFTAAAGTYNMYALIHTPNDNNDSFWVRANGGSWVKWNGLLRDGFEWRQLYNSDAGAALVSFDLLDGANTLDVAIRENGASIDKIYLSDSTMVPTGLGQFATNCETAQNSSRTSGNIEKEGERFVVIAEDNIEFYSLRLDKKSIIYPNPASDNVSIQLNSTSEISKIKIFDALGRICLSISGSKILSSKSHTFDISHLPTGLYFISIIDSKGEIYNHKLILTFK